MTADLDDVEDDEAEKEDEEVPVPKKEDEEKQDEELPVPEKEDEEVAKSTRNYESFHFIIILSSYFSYYNRYVDKIL